MEKNGGVVCESVGKSGHDGLAYRWIRCSGYRPFFHGTRDSLLVRSGVCVVLVRIRVRLYKGYASRQRGSGERVQEASLDAMSFSVSAQIGSPDPCDCPASHASRAEPRRAVVLDRQRRTRRSPRSPPLQPAPASAVAAPPSTGRGCARRPLRADRRRACAA